jgi:HK97 family phage major capsid protein
MKTIQELRDDMSHALRSAEDLNVKIEKENRLPNPDEKRSIDDFLAAATRIKEEIAAIDAAEAQRAKLQEAIAGLTQPAARKAPSENPNPNPVNSDTRIEIPGHQLRFGKLKAFRGKDAEVNALKAGMFLRAALFGSYTAARWCQSHGVETRAMSEGSNTAGGFLVPTEMSQAIIDLREEYGVFRRNVRVLPMGRDTITIPRRTSGLTATFTGEAVALTSSDKAFDQVQMVAKKLGVYTLISTELDEDAVISIADDIASEMAYAFALKEDQCGFNGDGTSTYGGIEGVVTKLVPGMAGAVDATSGHDTFEEVDAADLSRTMAKLPAYARMGAKWFCSAPAFDLIFSRLAVGAGGNTIQTVAGAVQRSYLGYPIEISQVLPTTTSTINNTPILLFGDLGKAATLGERRGISVKRSDELKFLEEQIAIKATERLDINVHDVGDASNAGPIVALVGNS